MRLIDADAAIDAVTKCEHHSAHITAWIPLDEAIIKLSNLPTAEPQWIPVSERLPEDEEPILFSTRTGRVHQGRFHKDNSLNQWYSSLDKMRVFNRVVNAWIPLPQPYKGETDG